MLSRLWVAPTLMLRDVRPFTWKRSEMAREAKRKILPR